jgi:lysozyme family protein
MFAPFAGPLLRREGGAKFTNRAADRGGPTKFGIIAATLGKYRRLGRDATAAEVQALQEPEAYAIYRQEYFVAPGFDQVALISPRVAEELLDTGVNMGPSWPARSLQEALRRAHFKRRRCGMR